MKLSLRLSLATVSRGLPGSGFPENPMQGLSVLLYELRRAIFQGWIASPIPYLTCLPNVIFCQPNPERFTKTVCLKANLVEFLTIIAGQQVNLLGDFNLDLEAEERPYPVRWDVFLVRQKFLEHLC
jgi:hypothetical protein